MKSAKSKRPPQMTFEINPELLTELKEIKRITKISNSQFIREAVWEKIAAVKTTHPAFQSLNSAKMPNQ